MKKSKLDKLSKALDELGVSLDDASKVKRLFIKTGSTQLDCGLGGGWLVGGIINVIGDESSGKSLLAQESAYMCQKDNGLVVFDDVETSLDKVRALKVFKLDPTTLVRTSKTVEDMFISVMKFCLVCKRFGRPGLYILDTYDALDTRMTDVTDEIVEKLQIEDMKNLINMRGKLDKAQVMSSVLGKLDKKCEDCGVTLMVISQTRAKIGAMFGEKTDIAGGKALKFYAVQRVKLAEIGKKKKGEKVIGIDIKAKVIKNKVIEPFHECEFSVYFNKGIDDIESCVEFLTKGSRKIRYDGKKFKSKLALTSYVKKNKLRSELRKSVRTIWNEKFKI